MYNGYGENDTNVQQCKYNGSYAQKWYISHEEIGGDCTNFLSQCLLAGGQMHQDYGKGLYIDRLNTTYHTIDEKSQISKSWGVRIRVHG